MKSLFLSVDYQLSIQCAVSRCLPQGSWPSLYRLQSGGIQNELLASLIKDSLSGEASHIAAMSQFSLAVVANELEVHGFGQPVFDLFISAHVLDHPDEDGVMVSQG